MSIATNHRHTIGVVGPDTQALAQRLSKAGVGEVVTYDEIMELIKRDPRGPSGRGTLTSARRIVQREQSIVFGVLPRIGIRRLSDAEIAKEGAGVLPRMHRMAKRGLNTLVCADEKKLNPTDRTEYLSTVSHVCALKAVTRIKCREQLLIALKIQPTPERLPVRKTLAVFTSDDAIDNDEK